MRRETRVQLSFLGCIFQPGSNNVIPVPTFQGRCCLMSLQINALKWQGRSRKSTAAAQQGLFQAEILSLCQDAQIPSDANSIIIKSFKDFLNLRNERAVYVRGALHHQPSNLPHCVLPCLKVENSLYLSLFPLSSRLVSEVVVRQTLT